MLEGFSIKAYNKKLASFLLIFIAEYEIYWRRESHSRKEGRPP